MKLICTAMTVLIAATGIGAQSPVNTGDVNCDGHGPDIEDLVYTVAYMFQGGPEPCDIPSVGIARKEVSVGTSFPSDGEWYVVDSLTLVAPASGYAKYDAVIDCGGSTRLEFRWQNSGLSWLTVGSGTIAFDSFEGIDTSGTHTIYVEVRAPTPGSVVLYRWSLTGVYYPYDYGNERKD